MELLFFLCRHFDKDRNGKLEHQEFKSCLRSLGYDLALLESGETDPEFEAVLDQVDPNRSAFSVLVNIKIISTLKIENTKNKKIKSL